MREIRENRVIGKTRLARPGNRRTTTCEIFEITATRTSRGAVIIEDFAGMLHEFIFPKWFSDWDPSDNNSRLIQVAVPIDTLDRIDRGQPVSRNRYDMFAHLRGPGANPEPFDVIIAGVYIDGELIEPHPYDPSLATTD